MAEALKNIYNQTFLKQLCKLVKDVVPNLNEILFLDYLNHNNWEHLELKARTQAIGQGLLKQFDKDPIVCLSQIANCAEHIQKKLGIQDQYDYIFFSDMVAIIGLNHPLAAFDCIEKTTILSSAEFAIRPFIVTHEKLSLEQLIKWTTHPHPSIRRLASEGCRPRLPWGKQLKKLVNNPKPICPILKNLKNDPSLFVRRSVANNLNDISKDHPKLVLPLFKSWLDGSPETKWVVKHAARTLIKQGNKDVLGLFGFKANKCIRIENFNIHADQVSTMIPLQFDFSLKNEDEATVPVRLAYYLYFKLKNGDNRKKIFYISEKKLAPKTTIKQKKQHHFKPISTKKYYEGEHFLSLVVNGVESEKLSFNYKP